MSDQFTTCEHGLRLHKCETCQFRDERDDALARIAELEAENARLKVIETAIKNVMRLRMVQLPRGPHCSAECLGTCEHCLALHELKTALAVKEQA